MDSHCNAKKSLCNSRIAARVHRRIGISPPVGGKLCKAKKQTTARRLFDTYGALRKRALRPPPRETFCGAKISNNRHRGCLRLFATCHHFENGNTLCALAKTLAKLTKASMPWAMPRDGRFSESRWGN